MSFHDDLILQDQASGERSQDQWSSGLTNTRNFVLKEVNINSTFQAVLGTSSSRYLG